MALCVKTHLYDVSQASGSCGFLLFPTEKLVAADMDVERANYQQDLKA